MKDVTFIWDVELKSLIGERVEVVTKQGSRMTGKITSIEYRTVEIAGQPCSLPSSIFLDEHERVDFATISESEGEGIRIYEG